MVTAVSAMFVDRINLRTPSGAEAKTFSCSSIGSEECFLSEDIDDDDSRVSRGRTPPPDDSSSSDEERLATGGLPPVPGFSPLKKNQGLPRTPLALQGSSAPNVPSPAAQLAVAPQRLIAGAPFKLELPASPYLKGHDASVAVTGAKGHLKLSKKGSSKKLLRKTAGPDHADGSLTARVRKLGALLSPRA